MTRPAESAVIGGDAEDWEGDGCLPIAEAILRKASSILRKVTDTPRLEAEVLLCHLTGLGRVTLLAHPERTIPSEQVSDYWTLVRRRAAGYPLPYLIGRAEFYGLEFVVTPEVLIPRPETELLVELALERRPQTVVDVGTGSGCIAVALAVHLAQVRVWATDLAIAALRVAAANVRRHGVSGRVQLVQADLVSPLVGPVDLVVSNPPYVAQEEWMSLPLSVRRYEPALALEGGAQGLAVIRRILDTAPRLLQMGGILLLEIGAAQGRAAAALVQALLPEAQVAIHRDWAGRERVLEVRR